MIKFLLVIVGVAVSFLLVPVTIVALAAALVGCAICDNDPPSYIGAGLTVIAWLAVQYLLVRLIRCGWSRSGYPG